MSVDIKGYNCPNCGGILLFDISTQKAKCRSCGAAFERAELAEYQWDVEETFDCADGGRPWMAGGEETFDCAAAPAAGGQAAGGSVPVVGVPVGGVPDGEATFERADAVDEETFDCAAAGDEDTFDCATAPAEPPSKTVWETKWDGEVWEDPESDDLTTGACPSCGAELYGGKTTVATVCPCCGNAQIVAKRIQGILKPDSIIPFQYDKDTAIEALGNFCAKRKRLLPTRFIKENRLDAIQGVYPRSGSSTWKRREMSNTRRPRG
ncbi:hypothetical protein R80B4_00387 [Fibrobacteres bacterium R8-0-B4]